MLGASAIADLARFSSPRKLVSYFGLDPKVRQLVPDRLITVGSAGRAAPLRPPAAGMTSHRLLDANLAPAPTRSKVARVFHASSRLGGAESDEGVEIFRCGKDFDPNRHGGLEPIEVAHFSDGSWRRTPVRADHLDDCSRRRRQSVLPTRQRTIRERRHDTHAACGFPRIALSCLLRLKAYGTYGARSSVIPLSLPRSSIGCYTTHRHSDRGFELSPSAPDHIRSNATAQSSAARIRRRGRPPKHGGADRSNG
jgi:hypothetical protein